MSEISKLAGTGNFRAIGRTLMKGLQKSNKAVGSTAKKERSALQKFMRNSPVMGILGFGAALGASELAVRGVLHAASTSGKEKAFNKAVNFDPEVTRWNRAQPEAVRARFNTLFRFNTAAAKDPLVASSWIKQTMEFPAVTPRVVTEIADRSKSVESPVMRIAEQALKQQLVLAVHGEKLKGFGGNSD